MGKEWTGKDILTKRINLADVERLTKECGYVLHGHHPAVQGAVLCELLAMWIKGHTPEIRQRLFLEHIRAVKEEIDA